MLSWKKTKKTEQFNISRPQQSRQSLASTGNFNDDVCVCGEPTTCDLQLVRVQMRSTYNVCSAWPSLCTSHQIMNYFNGNTSREPTTDQQVKNKQINGNRWTHSWCFQRTYFQSLSRVYKALISYYIIRHFGFFTTPFGFLVLTNAKPNTRQF